MRRRAVIYARSATGESDAIKRQVGACKAYCLERGYSITEDQIYSEIAVGTIETDSPELARLRKVAQQGLIDVLILASRDRLTRHIWKNALLTEQFKQLGIDIEIVDEQ